MLAAWQSFQKRVPVRRCRFLSALYKGQTFEELLSFHGGIAAVKDGDGAYHIDSDGQPLYAPRFERTFGFYAGLAAMLDQGLAFHIDVAGTPAYSARYRWCGNFSALPGTEHAQAPVRGIDGSYYVIGETGAVQSRALLYAGDANSSGQRVVWSKSGECEIVDSDGRAWCDDAAEAARWLEACPPHKGELPA
jgi:hypothetical protein